MGTNSFVKAKNPDNLIFMIFGRIAAKLGSYESLCLVRSQWPLILLTASFVLLGGAVIRKQVPRLYEATVVIDLEPGASGRLDGAAEPVFLPASRNDLKRRIAELGDRSLLEEAAARVDLVRRWHCASMGEAIELLGERLRVESDPVGEGIRLHARDLSREHAAALVNAIGDLYIARKDEAARNEAKSHARRIQEERDQAGREIEETEARLVKFSKGDEGGGEDPADLRRQLVTLLHLHRSLEAKYQQSRLAAEVAATPIRLSLPSSPNQARVIRHPWLSLPALFAMGLTGGVLVVLVRESRAGRRWDALADLMNRLDVPLAGFAPLANRSPVGIREFPDAWIEPYRELRNRLFRLPAGECPLLTIMPVRKNDPVAEAVASLGAVLADAGRTTLVIDADFRSPALHELFEAARHPGLSDYLTGEMRLEETVLKARRPNLWFMPTGPLPEDPGGLLGGRRMTDLIWQLKSRFDFILLLSPSIHEVSDGGLLANLADYTVVVTPSAGLSWRRLRETKLALDTVAAAMAGVVLTKPYRPSGESIRSQPGLPGARPIAGSR
jgi:capsular exopolysaccharide synthesis family protein